MLFERFTETVCRFPDRLAVVDPRRQVTFRQLWAGAVDLGRRLDGLSPAPADSSLRRQSHGASASAPVAILMPATVGFAVAFHAIQSAGRVALPLNFFLPPRELADVVADSGTQLILASRAFEPLTAALSAEAPTGVKVVYLEDVSADASPLAEPAGADATDRAGRSIGADQTCVLLYTSGSTGQPKGVMLSTGNLLADAVACVEHARMTPDERFLGVLPLFHTFGLTALLVIPSVLGATAYYLPRFSPRQVLETVSQRGISVLMAIPSMYGAMLKAARAAPAAPTGRPVGAAEARFGGRRPVGAALADCSLLISGGEPLSPHLFEQFHQQFGRPILEGYGLTETSPVVSLNVPGAARPGTVGRPLPNVEVRILDEAEQPCPAGVCGEVVVYGPIVMQGYHGRPEETRAALTADGGLRTGDIGRLDPDGFLTISGRKKDLIIVGGENVFPAEVETVLDAHPKVGQSAVIGLPDGVHGEMIAAFLTSADPADPPDAAELRSYCREHLAGYKAPRRFEIVPDLPVGPTGKILKDRLLDPGRGERQGASAKVRVTRGG